MFTSGKAGRQTGRRLDRRTDDHPREEGGEGAEPEANSEKVITKQNKHRDHIYKARSKKGLGEQ